MNMNRASHTPTPKPPSESRLPPTSHTLQPHHLQVLKLLSLVYHKYSDDQLPANFILHVYRVVLAEISEVRQPATYKEFVASVEEGAKATTPIAQKVLEEFKFVHTTIISPESISGFFGDYHHLVPPRDDEDTRPFARRSIFGYFVRRTYVSFLKLSFEGVTQLYQDYIAWVAGDYTGSFITLRWRAEVDRSAHNIFKTEADRKQFAQPDTYALWEKEQATGNNAAAADHLRSFFEQHFHENSDSGLRQHAMLNLARMHMLRHEYAAAYKLLQEAIMVSRTNNDKSTLQHCTGLLHRIPRTDRTRPYTINEIQPDLHPLEVLSDTKKLLHVGSQQPLSASFERIVQSVALYDNWVDVQRVTPVESEQWGQHAAQSVTWRTSGCLQVSDVEEAVVIAFTDRGSDDNTRLTMMLNRAYRHARQGKYQEAVAMLLHPDIFSGLTLVDYSTWASEIWHILVLRASRRGQERLFQDFLKTKRTGLSYSPREYWFSSFHPVGSLIRDPLHEVLSMRDANQAHAAVEPLLKSLWYSEFQQRFGAYRTGVILLADVGLDFGMTKWSLRLVEEIMPQIINGDDIEQRALACVTFARCMIATSPEPQGDGVRQCLPYLKMAEEDYATLEMYRAVQDTQFLLSVVYHNLGMIQERDDAATRCHSTEEEVTRLSTVSMEDWIADVWEVVSNLGGVLAAR